MNKFFVAAVTSLALLGTSPSMAAFGQKSTASAPRPAPAPAARPAQKSTLSLVKPAPSPSVAPKQGGFGAGQSLGLSRNSVTQNVRSGQTGVVQSRPAPSPAPQYGGGNGGGGNGFNGGNGYAQPSPNSPARQYSAGNVAAGAAVGAVAGYALGRATAPAPAPAPVTPIYQQQAPVQYQQQAPIQQAPVYDQQSGMQAQAPAPMVPAPQVTYAPAPQSYAVPNNNSGGLGFFGWLFILGALGGLGYVAFRMYKSGQITTTSKDGKQSFTVNSPFNESPKAILERTAQDLFISFQVNNTPDKYSALANNVTPVFYQALEAEGLLGAGAEKTVVLQLEAALVGEIEKINGALTGSVNYVAKLKETNAGVDSVSDINQVWHYQFLDGEWKLAGIEGV